MSFEYDSEAKLQYMVYPSGQRVQYTYDDLARHTGLKAVQSCGTRRGRGDESDVWGGRRIEVDVVGGIGGWATQKLDV